MPSREPSPHYDLSCRDSRYDIMSVPYLFVLYPVLDEAECDQILVILVLTLTSSPGAANSCL